MARTSMAVAGCGPLPVSAWMVVWPRCLAENPSARLKGVTRLHMRYISNTNQDCHKLSVCSIVYVLNLQI